MVRFFFAATIFILCNHAQAQKATVSIENRLIATYPYSDPNPIANLGIQKKKIYPYFSFDGYSRTSRPQSWKIVKLENDFIEVYILPEIGGKVWGAREKSTGKNFIYQNGVMKFRNVALRGPWTSGGIEFNFGIIGHTPSTASPVDYTTRQNEDGSVSCIVGNMDLPSRTNWRVEIRLPADKAWFETRALWDNNTPLSQSYYNWMTGAAVVSDDLEFFYPGDKTLEHNGEVNPWPVDRQGHHLSMYAQNAFGHEKSLHAVGEYKNFMGGYYHDSQFGFGHYSLYEEMPGRKLWLWALSRSGGIWEDLLTDTNGQYMEFQAGRGFNQFSPGTFNTSLSEMSFNSYSTDQWQEIWFPVKEIGGISEVSKKGTLYTKREKDSLYVAVNSLSFSKATITVRSNGEELISDTRSFKPMDVFKTTLALKDTSNYRIDIPEMELHYSMPDSLHISRPFIDSIKTDSNSASWLYRQAQQYRDQRNFATAKQFAERCIEKDAQFIDAYAILEELYFRSGLNDSAIVIANKALQLNTYHANANYYRGLAYAANHDFVNALESLGWAARAIAFRTAAYTAMSAIHLHLKNYSTGLYYSNLALEYNKNNLTAMLQKAVALRVSGDTAEAAASLEEVKKTNPLNALARFEDYLLHPSKDAPQLFRSAIHNEFPYQTYLEISLFYEKVGMREDALKALDMAPEHPEVLIRKAYLKNDSSALEKIMVMPADFIFPYRTEMLKPLQWAVRVNDNWKFKYYLALNYWALNRWQEAAKLFEDCSVQPDFYAFYSSRAQFDKEYKPTAELDDLKNAWKTGQQEWRTWSKLIEYFDQHNQEDSALHYSRLAMKKFNSNYTLALQYASALQDNGQFAACANILTRTNVLPFEGARQGKALWETNYAHLALEAIQKKQFRPALHYLALSRQWPENLGVGAPFDPDNRLQQYMEMIILNYQGAEEQLKQKADSILQYSLQHIDENKNSFNALIAIGVAQQTNQMEIRNKLFACSQRQALEGNRIHQWIIAMLNNDIGTIKKLEPSFLRDHHFLLVKQLNPLQKMNN